jgi:hypothetical protein
MLIIDSMVLDKPKKDKKQILKLLNLRDVAYLSAKQDWAIAGYKFESPYFDGSTSGARIVNVPESRLIRMSMETQGFDVVETTHPEQVAYRKEFQKLRGVKETFLVGLRIPQDDREQEVAEGSWWREKARLHEEIFCFQILPGSILLRWVNKQKIFVDSKFINKESGMIKNLFLSILYLASTRPTKFWARSLLATTRVPFPLREVLSNISRSPKDKIHLELAKHYSKAKNKQQAKEQLLQITQSLGSDWRSFYRACFLLMVIASAENDSITFDHYQHLLQTSNPEFPLTLAQGLDWLES